MSAGPDVLFHRREDWNARSTNSSLTKLCLSLCQPLWEILRSSGHSSCLQVLRERQTGYLATSVHWAMLEWDAPTQARQRSTWFSLGYMVVGSTEGLSMGFVAH